MAIFENVLGHVEHWFEMLVSYSILLMELIGVLIILWTVGKCI